MKRDMNLIRHLLLEIEAKDNGERSRIEVDSGNWSAPQVVEHFFMLDEAGLIEGRDASHLNGREYIPFRVTIRGHDFLDTIRDPDIWEKTKSGASAAGGFTIELLGDLAKGFIKTKIKQHTDIDI